MVRFLLYFLLLAMGSHAAKAVGQGLESEATHAVIMDYASGEVFWEKNGSQPMIPASMTKMMTAYVVFDRIRSGEIALTDQFTVSENAWREGGWSSGGSTMGLAIGDQPTVEELLRGMIILSGNDACIVLAEGISGTEEAFAREMTSVAQRLGLASANFRNSTGLDQEGHRISAIDLAKLAQLIIREFPDLYTFYAEREYEWRGIRQANRNPLLGRVDGADGLKTGHLSVSGYGLTASAEQDGARRITVINGMASEADRAREAERLMRLAFTGFETRYLKPAELPLPSLPVWMGTQDTVSIDLSEPILVAGAKRDIALGKVEVVYDGPLEAPIFSGQSVGTLMVTLPGAEPISSNLVATESIEKSGFTDRVLDGLNSLITGGGAS